MRIAMVVWGLVFWAMGAAGQDVCVSVNPVLPCIGTPAPGDTQISCTRPPERVYL